MKVEALSFVSHPPFPAEEACRGKGGREVGNTFGKEVFYMSKKKHVAKRGPA